MSLIIEHFGPPQGKGRLRHRIVRTRGKPMGFASGYTPPETRTYEAALAWTARLAMRARIMLAGPLAVLLEAFFPVPRSWSRKKQAEALSGLLRPTVKPDADNIAKCLDALNGVVWIDDAQVVTCTIEKLYSLNPRLRITITAAAMKADPYHAGLAMD